MIAWHKTPQQIAARWWVKRHSGSWSERDEKAFLQWRNAMPDHKVIYDRVEAACELAGTVHVAVPRPMACSRRPLFYHWQTISAVVLICAVATPIWHQFSDWWSGTPVTWKAPSNASRPVNLPDGTRIELDAGTEVTTQWGARARHAVVLRGEALFSVSHDSTRPLVVDVGPGRLTDLGTLFDVATLPTSFKVSVLEGSVGITTRLGEVVLTAGHGSGYQGSGELLSVIRVDRSVISWTEGVRHFDSVPLPEILDLLSRRHAVHFSLADPAVARLRLSGTLRMDELPVSLRTLGTALQLQIRWLDAHNVELTPKVADESQGGRPGQD
jgi:transmembrane sensor